MSKFFASIFRYFKNESYFIQGVKKMQRLVVIPMVAFSLILGISCLEEGKDQKKSDTVNRIRALINDSNYEGARLTALDTLDSEIRSLYFEADKYLGHASHEDVRCNERIAEMLYDIVKKVPVRETSINRDIYSELVTLYPENEMYRKKFIYYDRKMRGMIK